MASDSSAAEVGRKRNKKGRNPLEVKNVGEATRIRIARILEQFRISNDEVYTFEDDLKNHERAAVHVLCRKMGMISKSSGRGQQRRVSVYKAKKEVGTLKGKENLVSFRFSEKAQGILQDLFSQYPPNDMEMTGNKVGESSGKIDIVQSKRDDMFCKPAISRSEIANKVESLASRIEKDPNLRQINEERSKLPIASYRDVITATIGCNQRANYEMTVKGLLKLEKNNLLERFSVVLICGETGCGKTTQVPQFLMDNAWSKGETCKLVCTQPRRISAMSVAERIASERGENIGDSVGYKIRLESKGGRHSSLVFCTNGVLLRVLVSAGSGRLKKRAPKKIAKGVADITHIIVDEIHERDRFSDFILAIIRDILPSYPHLRVVLMSATIDAERFSKYFGGCPIIQVPGFTYPVKTFYLEDVLQLVRSTENNHPTYAKRNETVEDSSITVEYKIALDEAIDLALLNDEFDSILELLTSEGDRNVFNYQHSKTGVTPLMVFAGKGRVGDICMLLSFGVDCNIKSNAGMTALDYAQQADQAEATEIIKQSMENKFINSEEEQKLLDRYLTNVDTELIDCVLIEQLLRRICKDSKEGAILVFLPGWDDINRMREKLISSPYFKDPSTFVIISMHSMIPSVEQKKVFKRPSPGCRKIVLSTNIAETSVTIEDVVYVVDTGKMKEKSYDPYNNVSTLHSSWISKASAKQREGRAGRCQPGICYHLYSKLRATSLPDFQVPEIKRMPIEELCLQVKLIDPSCKIEDFLQKTLDPPVYETIRNAITVLQDIGALSLDEQLTDLGQKLGSLPVHPVTSKMLFLGILLNCLDPALTLACASDYRDPFILPMLPNEKKKATAAKLELASYYGGNGDQLAVVAAFECWRAAKANGEENRFCSSYFVSSSTMRMLSGMRKQLESELIRNAFITEEASRCSLNAQDPGILHAVLVAGLYPMVGRLLSNNKRSVIETVDGNKVRLHPSSTNFKLSFKKCSSQPIIVFDEITRGDGGLYIRNCSTIGYLPLLLLATEIVVAPGSENEENEDEDTESEYEEDESDEDKAENNDSPNTEKIMSSPDNSVKVVVDRWLPFESTALDVAQMYCLRERLSAAILFKVTHPHNLQEHLGATMHAISSILSCDGMSGISLPFETVDSLTTMVGAADIIGQPNPRHQLPKNYRGRQQNFGSHYQRGNASNFHTRPSIPRVANEQQFYSESGSISEHGPSMYRATTASRGYYSKRSRGNRNR